MTLNKQIVFKVFGVIMIFFLLTLIFLWFYYKKIETKYTDDISDVSQARNIGEGGLTQSKNMNSEPSIQKNLVSPDINNISVNGELSIKNTAILVASKMGSYSTDTFNFSNLRDISSLMTDNMNSYVDDLIDRLSTLPDDGSYYGVTTKALSVEVVDPSGIESGVVDTIVSCQRVEVTGKDNPVQKIKYQKLKMKLLKQDDKWLADEVEWL